VKTLALTGLVIFATALPTVTASPNATSSNSHVITRIARAFVGSNEGKGLSVRCPRGTTLIGGGFRATPALKIFQSSAEPSLIGGKRPQAWRVAAFNTGSNVENILTVQALCLK
jgi:hypothetical protein